MVKLTNHGMCFSCPSHSIGETGHIEAIENVWNKRFQGLPVDIDIWLVLCENGVKLKRFVAIAIDTETH